MGSAEERGESEQAKLTPARNKPNQGINFSHRVSKRLTVDFIYWVATIPGFNSLPIFLQ